jgi:hypothetical protein
MIDELSRHATVRYEHGSGVTIDRWQGRDARECDGVTMFGRVDEKLGRRQDHRRTALGCRDCLHQVRNGLAQGRQPDATRQDDRLGKAAIARRLCRSTAERWAMSGEITLLLSSASTTKLAC